jgi:hypothetical protein
MRNPATPTVDQLLVLLTVAEAGSFTAAAKRLGRATYSVKPSPLTSADRSEHPTASANQLQQCRVPTFIWRSPRIAAQYANLRHSEAKTR